MSTLRLRLCGFALALVIVVNVRTLPAVDLISPSVFRESLAEKLHLADQKQAPVIEGRAGSKGQPGWLFFTAELRSVLSTPFWGDDAVKVSRSANPKFADPLPPILDFHRQLKAAGIELWVVPVPAKIAVYPQELASGPYIQLTGRIDQSHERFYIELRNRGVSIIDLNYALQLSPRNQNPSPSFCCTDSHWSGAGVRAAAKNLGTLLKKSDWYPAWPKKEYQTERLTVEITGDLATLLNEKNPVKERLALTRVFQIVDGKPVSISDDPKSPVLLLGDSHTLVFHDPTLYAEGCGLADHLAEQLGFAMDVIGVRGSGANAARLNWRRREDPLAGKKLVIWCFSMREFTENTDGWRVIPITKR